MVNLTERQLDILEFIQHHIDAYGYAPTLREIGADVGLASTSSVSYYLDWLQGRGYLNREAYKARAVSLTLLGMVQLKNEALGIEAAHETT